MKKVLFWFVFACLLAACARPQSDSLRPGNHDLSLDLDGLTRAFILHVPPAASEGQPLPLLIVLHGGGGTGQKMQRFLGFDALILLSLGSLIASLILDTKILPFLVFFFGVWGGIETGRYLEAWMRQNHA